MNGTIYEEIKKNEDSKKKEKIKFALAIISTNIMVALLSLSFASNPALPKMPSPPRKILHPQFKMVVIPLNVLIDLDQGASEIPVTLMSKSKKVLISRAYIHEMVPGNIKDLSAPRFKIEIPESEVLKLSADDPEAMIAIPEIKLKEKVLKSSSKRVSPYEINL